MLKKTAQTKFIYEYIKNTRRHPSAEEIYSAASSQLPYITRATVYNVLRRLLKAGEIRQLHIKKGLTVYDGYTAPHPHLKCRLCGRIEDLDLADFEDFAKRVKQKYEDAEVELNITATCSLCSTKERSE